MKPVTVDDPKSLNVKHDVPDTLFEEPQSTVAFPQYDNEIKARDEVSEFNFCVPSRHSS
jgi:hypothetical protein